MTKRFKNADDVVGQFLPKVYTRRLTLEDTKIVKERTMLGGRRRRTRASRKTKTPGTAITVDYHIKDVLDESGLGVITNNQRPDEDPNQIQDEILSSLKVALMLFGDNTSYETVLNQLHAFRRFGWAQSLPSVMPSFEEYLKEVVELLNRNEDKVELKINNARPEIGFEVRNSQYQEYDVNNNLINIIPYKHTFKVENSEFGSENLSLICFTYFDFSSLSLDELSSEEVRRLGYMTGDITADVITRGNRIQSTSLVYRDAITRVPYYGPVHSMGDGTLMTGMTHRENSRRLVSRQVPMTKIQDFRSMERMKETNYQPSVLQTFDDSIPSLDLLEKKYKNFFNVEDVIIDFDRIDKVVNIEFTLDMASIYRQTRYYDLMKSNQSAVMFGFPALIDLLEITVLRRRVTKRPIGHDKLSGRKRVEFDQVEEDDYVVATSGQNASAGGGVAARNITTKEDGDSKIMELPVSGFGALVRRKFFIEDRQCAEFLGTGAVFQYGISLKIKDPTKDRFIAMLQTARVYLKELNLYLQEASIPVFDSRMIRKQDPTQPISMDLISDAPQYGESVQHGNYNTVNNTLDIKFVRKAKDKYKFDNYVNNYVELIQLAFAKSEVSMYHFSNPTQGNDGERGTVNEGNAAGIRATPLDLLMTTEGMSMDTVRTAMYNMINPSNTRPEAIQSFIKTYQDLVMDLEDYFDIGYEHSLTTEGGGYSARGDNTIKLERWFSNVEETPDGSHVDSDNYIEMDPLQKIFFRYWRETDLQRGFGIPEVSAASYADRMRYESTRYSSDGQTSTTVDRLTPISIVVGDDEVYFDEKEMKNEENARRARKKAEQLKRLSMLAKYNEQKRLGIAPKRKPYKRELQVRRQVLATPEQGKLINNFVQEVKKYTKTYGAPAANSIIGAMNKAPHYGTPISSGNNTPSASYTMYFDFMSSITEEMADGAFRYSNSFEELERANRTLSDIDIEEFISSNVSCGLVDNRPSGNEVINRDGTFEREEGLYPGILNILRIPPNIRLLPPTPEFQDIPRLPQLDLPNFPMGPIFEGTGIGLGNNRAQLPAPPQITIDPPIAQSGPQSMPPVMPSMPPAVLEGVPDNINPGIGAVNTPIGSGATGPGPGTGLMGNAGSTGPLGSMDSNPRNLGSSTTSTGVGSARNLGSSTASTGVGSARNLGSSTASTGVGSARTFGATTSSGFGASAARGFGSMSGPTMGAYGR